MRSTWIFLVALLACSSTQNSTTDGGTTTDGSSGGSCKTFTDFCQALPLARLQSAFAAPMLTAKVTSATPDSALGPRYVCHYQQDDATLTINFDLSYECFTSGASAAKSNFDGRKGAIQSIGNPVEDVTGVGDEAYWQYSANNGKLTQGNLNARTGAMLVQLGGYGHSTKDPNGSPSSISVAVAKQHAIDGVTLLVTQVR